MLEMPFVQSVFHPSDFSEGSHAAFRHALGLVLYHQARFTVLHVVAPDEAVDVWADAPRVRETLVRWGVLGADSPASDLKNKLALWVDKVNVRSADPLQATMDELKCRPSDLVVLANEERRGLPAWLAPSMAERVMRRPHAMTLFVPPNAAGFVSRDDGSVELKRILVPIVPDTPCQPAVNQAARASIMSTHLPVEIVLLELGTDGLEAVTRAELSSCQWAARRTKSNSAKEVVRVVEEIRPDLIVMPTADARGVFKTLRGSLAEQVLGRVDVPLLAVSDEPDPI